MNAGDIDAVVSTDTSDGGDDTITIGSGRAIVVGGQGNDTIAGGVGTAIVLGDSGMISPPPPTSTGSERCRSRRPHDDDLAGDRRQGSDHARRRQRHRLRRRRRGHDHDRRRQQHRLRRQRRGRAGAPGRTTGFLDATDPTVGRRRHDHDHRLAATNWVVGGTGGDTSRPAAATTSSSATSRASPATSRPCRPSRTRRCRGRTPRPSRPSTRRSAPTTRSTRATAATSSIGGQGRRRHHDRHRRRRHRRRLEHRRPATTATTRSSSGAGDDVVAGDNASILPDGLLTTHARPDADERDDLHARVTVRRRHVRLPAEHLGRPGAAIRSTRCIARVVLFDGGATGVAGNFGNDILATGDGNDLAFGQNGNDAIWAGTGNDYVEGGAGSDLIYGGLGQDDLIGGNSDLFSLTSRRSRAPTAWTRSSAAPATRSASTTPRRHVGDRPRARRRRDRRRQRAHRAASSAGSARILQFNYDNYAGDARAHRPARGHAARLQPVRRRVVHDVQPARRPTGASTVPGTGARTSAPATSSTASPATTSIYGETGDDRIFGDGAGRLALRQLRRRLDLGGAGDDGVLGDDGLLLLARNGIAEPLYGLAATTQVTLGTGDADSDDIVVTVDQTGHLTYTGDRAAVLGRRERHHLRRPRRRLPARRRAATTRCPAPRRSRTTTRTDATRWSTCASRSPRTTRRATRSASTGGRACSGTSTRADPFAKIMVDPARRSTSCSTSRRALAFDPATSAVNGVQPVRDDGVDVLFGDAGNDWLVGGTNTDFLFGGWGNDLLQADDNLDSTKVTTLTASRSRTTASARSPRRTRRARTTTSELCGDLSSLQSQPLACSADRDHEPARRDREDGRSSEIGGAWTADEVATLVRLLQRLKPDYDPLANDIVDPRGTGPSYADLAFGGGGWDIMIANTASDRLVDWHDDVNVFYFPWKGDDDGVAHPRAACRRRSRSSCSTSSLALGADPTRPESCSRPTSRTGKASATGRRGWTGPAGTSSRAGTAGARTGSTGTAGTTGSAGTTASSTTASPSASSACSRPRRRRLLVGRWLGLRLGLRWRFRLARPVPRLLRPRPVDVLRFGTTPATITTGRGGTARLAMEPWHGGDNPGLDSGAPPTRSARTTRARSAFRS